MSEITVSSCEIAIGIDLGVKHSQVCVNRSGTIDGEFAVASTPVALRRAFESLPRCRVLMEVSGMSPWVSRLLEGMGFETIVCKPTTLKDLVAPSRKNDRDDARGLAKICEEHLSLVSRIKHRPEHIQEDVAVLRMRDNLVKVRTLLINTVRGILKSLGSKVPPCSAETFPKKVREKISLERSTLVDPLVQQIDSSSKQIALLDEQLVKIGDKYPAVRVVGQVPGVGPITSLAYVLTIHDPSRFKSNRAVGNYLGLTPRQKQSGDHDPQLRISKAGDSFVRRLLVLCAQYILGRSGPDSDLRRFGLERAKRGGKGAKKRAVVAVARRLAVVMLSLWKSGEEYEPLRHANQRQGTSLVA